MGLYSRMDEDSSVDMDALIEAFLIDDLMHNYTDEAVQEFCAPGGVADALLEAKVLSNDKTAVRLSKKSDAKRRMVITAINMAKAKKDPLYAKLVKYQILRKQTRQKIVDKYGSKAARVSVKAQREYIKSMRGVNLSNNINDSITTARAKQGKH